MVKTMTIATIDIGGTGIKFASLTPDGKILNKTSIPTPESLEDLLAWLDQCLSEQDYSGIAMSVPGAVNQETGVIDGFSAVPYIHGFSWYEALSSYQIPVHLENDANCVGLSELLAHPELENAACVVIGTRDWRSHDYQWQTSPRSPRPGWRIWLHDHPCPC